MDRVVWTEESITNEASKHAYKCDFVAAERGAVKAARRLGIYEEVCAHMPKMKVKWTGDKLHKEALKFKTRGEFAKRSSSACGVARRKGKKFFESICEHMVSPRTYWTEDLLYEVASKYVDRKTFREIDYKAWNAAYKLGILKDICSGMSSSYINWTKELAHKEALKFKTRGAFQKGSSKAYKAGLTHGWLEDICSHMKHHLEQWTFEKIHFAALEYKTKSEFRYGNQKAYRAAKSWGVVELVCEHMQKSKSTSDNNVIYIWKDTSNSTKSKNIYKVGVTSAKCGTTRIGECASRIKIGYSIITVARVKGKATSVESELLQRGKDAEYTGFKGSSEFRIYTDNDLKSALKIIETARDKRFKEFKGNQDE